MSDYNCYDGRLLLLLNRIRFMYFDNFVDFYNFQYIERFSLAIIVGILYVILMITIKYRTYKAQKQNDAQLAIIKKELVLVYY
jgi:hypothetical protein